MKDEKEKKKLPLGRTVSNCVFALKAIWTASPIYIFVYLASSVLMGSLDFLSETYLLRRVVNGLDSGEEMKSILIFVVILGAISIVFYAALEWFWHVVSPRKQRRITVYIEKQLYRKSAEVELACYENPEFYDKYVRAMDEAYNRITGVMETLDGLISRIIALTANSMLLFIIDPWLIVFGLFPLLLGFFRKAEYKASHDLSVSMKPIDRRANYTKRTFYLGEYAKEMRIGGMYRNMLRDFRQTFEDYKGLMKKYGVKCAVLRYIQNVGLEVVTILGAMLYAVWSALAIGAESGGMSVGDCIVVLGSVGTISYCLNYLVQNLADFGEHALFIEDVRFFLDYDPKIKDGEKSAPADSGELVVSGVNFRYEGSDKDTLKNVSFTWRRGERIALVGSNGSGKTTLVKLLLRLYDPSSGEITMGGESIKSFSLSSYRDSFSTVFQDFKMFSMSVRDNVLLRPPREGDDKLVINALKESGAYDKISRFEKGIDTVLTREFDDKGENLSVGEAQKLSLARVFADPTPFVLLDEPSSALDPIAEYTMFENMMRATAGRSVLFISHRLSSATLADKVLLMEDGTITECGTHAELMAKGGRYAEMFHRQAENYLGEEATDNE